MDLLLQWEVCKLNPFQKYSERGYWYINWEYLEDSGIASCSVRIEFSGKSSFMRDFRGKIRIEKRPCVLSETPLRLEENSLTFCLKRFDVWG